jgi:hypothetical protein
MIEYNKHMNNNNVQINADLNIALTIIEMRLQKVHFDELTYTDGLIAMFSVLTRYSKISLDVVARFRVIQDKQAENWRVYVEEHCGVVHGRLGFVIQGVNL